MTYRDSTTLEVINTMATRIMVIIVVRDRIPNRFLFGKTDFSITYPIQIYYKLKRDPYNKVFPLRREDQSDACKILSAESAGQLLLTNNMHRKNISQTLH